MSSFGSDAQELMLTESEPAIAPVGKTVTLARVDACAHFFEVQVDLFAGPIDLLLHLVKQQELPIEKLSLAQVTSQYLTCLEQMQSFDLEIASEYLVIAATLVSIKTSVLLSEPAEFPAEEDGPPSAHEELLRRLREAAVFKDSAQELGSRRLLGVDVFAPLGLDDGSEPALVRYQSHNPMLLGRAFQKLVDRLSAPELYSVTVDSISIVERMMGLLGTLEKSGGSCLFTNLVGDLVTRHAIVGTFIAMLELCKRRLIEVRQAELFDDIMVELVGAVSGVQLESEFDVTAQNLAISVGE